MTVSKLNARILVTTFGLLAPVFSFAQAPVAPSAQAPPAAQPAIQAPAVPSKAAPDYPDPRTLMLGVFYFAAQPSTQPEIKGGSQATAYQDVSNLGKEKAAFGAEASYPITRTGTIVAEYFINKGDGSQTTTVITSPFAQTYPAGTKITSSYNIQHGRVYLDDLLFPHFFPVRKFRLKSIWAFEYTKMSATFDTPGVASVVDSSGNTTLGTITGSHTTFLPELGAAAEYAIAPHVLLRADAAGFGIPHSSEVWEANATVSWRVHNVEVVAGGKILHFKTTPNASDYLQGTVDGAFAGVRYHFNGLF